MASAFNISFGFSISFPSCHTLPHLFALTGLLNAFIRFVFIELSFGKEGATWQGLHLACHPARA
jgi:hypothetical protein